MAREAPSGDALGADFSCTVVVEGQEMLHELTRENSLSQEQLDSWQDYIAAVEKGQAEVADQ